ANQLVHRFGSLSAPPELELGQRQLHECVKGGLAVRGIEYEQCRVPLDLQDRQCQRLFGILESAVVERVSADGDLLGDILSRLADIADTGMRQAVLHQLSDRTRADGDAIALQGAK